MRRKTFLNAGACAVLAPFQRSPAFARANPNDSAPASLVVSRTQTGSVPPGLAGFSYEKSKLSTPFFKPSNHPLVGRFTDLGKSVLRIGGNSADRISWAPGGAGQKRGLVAPSDIDALGAFLRATGWRLIYTINLGKNTPEAAAAEATAVAAAAGSDLLSLEIGNECDDYAKNGLRPATYAVADFIAEWSSFAQAIRNAAPGVPISGPAAAYRLEDWTIPFAAAQAAQIEFVSQHLYFGDGKNASSTMARLLSAHAFVPSILGKLHDAAYGNHISGGFRLTETNSLYSGGAAGVSDAHGAALWAIDLLLTGARFGCAGVNFHGGGDGTYNPNYTPIADVRSVISELRPVYYAMLFVSHVAAGPLYDVAVTTDLNLSAYAVGANHGATHVVVVNKEPATTAAVSLDTGGPVGRAETLVLTAPSLGSLGATKLDGGAALHVGGKSQFSIDVAPASAVLMRIS